MLKIEKIEAHSLTKAKTNSALQMQQASIAGQMATPGSALSPFIKAPNSTGVIQTGPARARHSPDQPTLTSQAREQQQQQDRQSSHLEEGDQQQIQGPVYMGGSSNHIIDEKKEEVVNELAVTDDAGLTPLKNHDSGYIRAVEIDYKGVPLAKRENKQFGSEIDDFGIGSVDLGSACASPLLPDQKSDLKKALPMANQKVEENQVRKKTRHKDTLKLTALDDSWRKVDTSPATINHTLTSPMKFTDVNKLNSDISEELLASAGSQPRHM